VNPSLRPPGGYWFVDADEVEHRADDVPKLIKSLIEYRVRVGRPPGDPEKEVHDQICARSPGVCLELDSSATQKSGLSPATLVAQITAKMVAWYRESRANRLTLVEAKEASQRAAACEGCPLNVEWSKTCPPCFTKAQKVFPLIVSPVKPLKELKGRACLNAGDDLSVACWVNGGPKVTGAPDNCWRKS
jgi:hypothetical protein